MLLGRSKQLRPALTCLERAVRGFRRCLFAGDAQHIFSTNTDAIKKPRVETLVLLRHGESEGNVAYDHSIKGDHSLYAGDFLERHSSLWRLTEKGEDQAKIAGEWLRSNNLSRFDCLYTSEYVRAMETSGLLGLKDAKWRSDLMLRERDWGEWDLCSQQERRENFGYERRRRRESLFWAPPGGESLAQVVQRVDSFLMFVNRRFSGGKVFITCHGELMWAFRLRFERLTQLQYREMQAQRSTEEKIHNCQLIVYSRRCPETGTLYPSFRFMRFVCPWDLSRSGGDSWRPLHRSGGSTNGQLLEQARRFPRMYNNRSSSMQDPELRRHLRAYQVVSSSSVARAP